MFEDSFIDLTVDLANCEVFLYIYYGKCDRFDNVTLD